MPPRLPLKRLVLIVIRVMFMFTLQFPSGGSWERTFAPEVVSIYSDIRLDPVSIRAVEFSVQFDGYYSSACIEDIKCERCDKRDWNWDCSSFVTENLANTSKVFIFIAEFVHFVSSISLALPFRKISIKKTQPGLIIQN